MTHPYVCDMTHSYVRDMTHSYEGRDSFICGAADMDEGWTGA